MCCYCSREKWNESDCCVGNKKAVDEVTPVKSIGTTHSSTYSLGSNFKENQQIKSNLSNYPGKEFSDWQMNCYKGRIMMNQAKYTIR